MNSFIKYINRFGLSILLVVLAQSAAYAAQQSITVNKIAAVVNGEMITLHEVQKYAIPEITRQGFTGNTQKDAAGREAITRQILDKMILEILVREEAERLQITVSDAEVDNEMRKLVQKSQLSQEDFERQLALQGGDIPMLKEKIKDSVLKQRLISIMVARKVVITKEEVARYYEEHKAQFLAQDAVNVSLIVFAPTSNARDIVAKIKSGKLNFAEAAKQYSIEPSGVNGGLIGAISWREMNPQWKDLLVGLNAGEVTDIFSIDNYSAVLQLNSSISGNAMTMEEVTPQIENILRAPKLEERFNDYTKQLRSKAVVDIRL